MYDRAIDTLRELLHMLPPQEPWRSLTREAIFLAVVTAGIVAIEAAYKRDLGRYRSRGFLNDVAYNFFYQGGIYTLFVYIPIFTALQKQLPIFDLGLLKSLPSAWAFLVFWLIADFIGYWVHRMQHTVPFFWAFHSIHHGPKQITFATSSRNHPIDQLMANVIVFIPILILGAPKKIWIPMLLIHTALETLQHAALTWKFGPLYRVVVSPLFHNLHHSSDASEYNGNYSKILSVWDFLFGTAVDRDELPAKFGIDGMEIPETVSGQLLTPFYTLAGRKASPAAPVVVPNAAESA
jgi:sterol desaturase/sphingolipid hydroxylase (fatty acid hydroxylase superfamily)